MIPVFEITIVVPSTITTPDVEVFAYLIKLSAELAKLLAVIVLVAGEPAGSLSITTLSFANRVVATASSDVFLASFDMGMYS